MSMDDEQLHTQSTGAWLWDKTKRTGFSIMFVVCSLGVAASALSLWNVHVSPVAGLEGQRMGDTWVMFVALLLFTTEAWVAARNLHGEE